MLCACARRRRNGAHDLWPLFRILCRSDREKAAQPLPPWYTRPLVRHRGVQPYQLCALRRLALPHTQFAKATCGTIRLKLLKIGALVRTSVRRITLAMASSYPYQRDFALAHAELTNATAR